MSALLAAALVVPAMAPAAAFARTDSGRYATPGITAVTTTETVIGAESVSVTPPSLSVPSAMISTLDGDIRMWTRNANSPRRVASTIKMLNALVVRENADLDEIVTVPKAAEAITDGDVGLKAGQKISVRQLLRLMLVCSANDAAEAIAFHVSGSEGAYVRLMNAKAAELGLKSTVAADPSGLSKRESSTAMDLSIIARNVMADPVLRAIVRERSVQVPLPGGGSRTEKSTNLMLGSYSGIEGVKTGYTNPAGFCFVGAAKRGNVELVGVVLGASTNTSRFTQMRKLLDWGFKHTRERKVVSADATMGVVPVLAGTRSTVTARAATSFKAIQFDGDPLVTKVRLRSPAFAPVKRGQKLGYAQVFRAGKLVGTVALLADKDVPLLLSTHPSASLAAMGETASLEAPQDTVSATATALASASATAGAVR